MRIAHEHMFREPADNMATMRAHGRQLDVGRIIRSQYIVTVISIYEVC